MANLNSQNNSKQFGEDMLVAGCGAVTCLATAIVLWWIEQRFGVSLYTWMLWLVIPGGAILAGFAGASGFYAGAWHFGHRPTQRMLLNMIMTSVATYFLIQYLGYRSLLIDGKHISGLITFPRYLDILTRTSSLEIDFRGMVKLGRTGRLEAFGYVVAVLQILGFAAGGLGVYSYLTAQPYCEKCSRFLTRKDQLIRFVDDPAALQMAAAEILTDINSGAIAFALDVQKHFGNPKIQRGSFLRTVFEVRHCENCDQHWVKFAAEKMSGGNWKEINPLRATRFIEGNIDI